MGFRFNLGKNKIVNLTLKDYAIRFVELKQANPPFVQKYGERFLPEGIIREGRIQDRETLITILEECIADWKIERKQVRFIIPDHFVIIRKLAIPSEVKPDEIDSYLFMEVGTSIHLPFENPVFDFVLLPKNDQQQEILLFAGPEEIIQEYRDVLEEVKLKPITADISSLSVYRLYHQQYPEDIYENVMFIQADLQSVNVCIFEHQHPLVMRHITMDVDQSKWEYSYESKDEPIFSGTEEDILHPLEDAYVEIERVMNFYNYSLNQGLKLVTKIVVDGDHPWLKKIVMHMQDKFEIPTVVINRDEIQISPSFHLNIGLGLKEVK